MKTFTCECDARIFFRNTQCLACQRELGFLPDRGLHSALEPIDGEEGVFSACAAGGERYRKCRNYAEQQVCNWMVPDAESAEQLCRSCRLNRVIPSLDQPEHHGLWSRIEVAKRHLVYTLLALKLPFASKQDDEERGLAFDFLAPTPEKPVLTGHVNGVITLNVTEADPVAREETRVKMGEHYRTLLGHFRHEVGHYYFGLLVGGGAFLERFRELFGDERDDYAEALKRHYASSPPEDWSERYISTYAAAHPWEDWAETWAHYLHMRDTLETAQAFGLVSQAARLSRAVDISSFDHLLAEWIDLTVALNALNRSMGLPDPYPFQISALPAKKLAFVHEVVRSAGDRAFGLHVDRDAQALGAASEHDAAERARVAEVSSPRQADVAITGDQVVRGIEVEPAEAG
jgi:hypothetical protein